MAKTRRRAGDRRDGRLLRSLPAFSKFIPYIMPTRNDAHIFYDESFEVSTVDRTLRRLRVEGYKGIGMLHFLIAAYIRCISMLPGINRFIAGRRIYAHDDIVYRKMNEKIEEIKTSEEDNNTEEVAETLTKMPRFLLRFAIAVLRVMDYFGLIPDSLIEASPFHGSMIITDLGSLRIGPVFHHIYNFGTLPVFIAFGAKRHAYEIDRHGKVVDNKYVDCKFVMDERIADGHYFAQFLQAYRYLFQHPEILEKAPSRVIEDVR